MSTIFDASGIAHQSGIDPARVDDGFHVEGLEESRQNDWDAYVASSPDATIFHRVGWMRAVRDTTGTSLVICWPGKGAGFGESYRSSGLGPVDGRALISVPYAVNGGPAADTLDVESSLVNQARRIAEQSRVDYVEFRNLTRSEGLIVRDHYYAFRAPMPTTRKRSLVGSPEKRGRKSEKPAINTN